MKFYLAKIFNPNDFCAYLEDDSNMDIYRLVFKTRGYYLGKYKNYFLKYGNHSIFKKLSEVSEGEFEAYLSFWEIIGE